MSLVNEQALFLKDVAKLIEFATSKGFVVTGGELYRPAEMQEIYIKTGRSKTMNSMHLKKCAVDLNFFEEVDGRVKLTYEIPKLKPIGDFWESLRPGTNSWGATGTRSRTSPISSAGSKEGLKNHELCREAAKLDERGKGQSRTCGACFPHECRRRELFRASLNSRRGADR